jgi:NADH dehydrogenase FAD-containing subunit
LVLKEHNYWLTTAEFPKTNAGQPLPERVDVAVIGAGFTGLSAARTLANRGANGGRPRKRNHWLGR